VRDPRSEALKVIPLSLALMVVFNVFREKMTQDLMTILSRMYKKSSTSNNVFLTKKLLNLKMADNRSVAKQLNEFNTLMSQLESVGIIFDDKIRALVLLSTLS